MKKVNKNGIEFLVVDDTANSSFWDIPDWEIGNYQILSEMSKNHSTFFHAGSWIGPFTLYCSNLYEKVYGLEPDIVAYEELIRNIELNGYKNIIVENKGLFSKDGSINIGSDYSELGRSGTSLFQNNNSITVETTTISNYFKKYNLPKNCMMQIDVEGSEYCLFSNTEFFREYTPTILLSFHLTFLSDENYDILYDSLSKLSDFYIIDLVEISKQRSMFPYGQNFGGFDLLIKPKS